ncbi:Uncharacterised protein [Streptococcus pneumoniae]|nr:Uncharacterised protein [Streptococcus pneumoniae]VJY93168.1 Uncharacterised protein [Streptococcus pneumoniae]VJZ91210.1 Uncharacterised protein [Streptococcus pneumoniae]VKM55377.1 Uncharacterised protein [Streptococcus pneumoniae]VMH97355.1 Uncharacterised protein [Streptococcus pneumoniae]
MEDEQNILETQLILGKQVLEIVLDFRNCIGFAKRRFKNRGSSTGSKLKDIWEVRFGQKEPNNSTKRLSRV